MSIFETVNSTALATSQRVNINVHETMSSAFESFKACSAGGDILEKVSQAMQGINNALGMDLGFSISEPTVQSSRGGKLNSETSIEVMKMAYRNLPRMTNLADKVFMQELISNPNLEEVRKQVMSFETGITVDPTQSASFQENQKLSQLAHQLYFLEQTAAIAIEAKAIFDKAGPFLMALLSAGENLSPKAYDALLKFSKLLGVLQSRVTVPMSNLLIDALKFNCNLVELFKTCSNQWNLESPVICDPRLQDAAIKSILEQDEIYDVARNIILRLKKEVGNKNISDLAQNPQFMRLAMKIYFEEQSESQSKGPLTDDEKMMIDKMLNMMFPEAPKCEPNTQQSSTSEGFAKSKSDSKVETQASQGWFS